MKPTVGQIVLYTLDDNENDVLFTKHNIGRMHPNQVLPGIVVVTGPTDAVALNVFLPGQDNEYKPFVDFSKDPKPGHWYWPVKEVSKDQAAPEKETKAKTS